MHIEKSAHAFAAKQDAVVVTIRLDGVFDTGFGERGFEAQSILELLGDVDEIQFLLAEKRRVAAHSGSILARPDLLDSVRRAQSGEGEGFGEGGIEGKEGAGGRGGEGCGAERLRTRKRSHGSGGLGPLMLCDADGGAALLPLLG